MSPREVSSQAHSSLTIPRLLPDDRLFSPHNFEMIPKILHITGENDTPLLDCQLMYRGVVHSAMMQVVFDVFYVEVFIETRKGLTGWQVLIKQQLMFIE